MNKILAAALAGCLASPALLAADASPERAPLFEAIRAGDSAAVRDLLQGGADLTARNKAGDTPLMAAAMQSGVDVLELLIKAGADVNATNEAGATALMRGATFGDKVRLLVASGADVKAHSRLGNTALILAARLAGNSRTVEFLLDHGADPNAKNVFGATALMAAASAGDLDTVRLLLDRGADINAKPNLDGNAFIWGGGRTALMWAAFYGNEPLLKLLLERGAKVNVFTAGGGPLEQAAWGGQVGAARLLLDAGAPVDQRDLVANYTPLHWAASAERSSPELVKLLLARGANVNAEGGQPVDNYLGVLQTPLMLARRRGDTPIVRALLEAGAKDAAAPARGDKAAKEASASTEGNSIAAAIQRAVPQLTKTAEESVATFLRHTSKQDCVSCHQQQIPLPALSLAHSRQIATDREATRHQIELVKRSFWIGHIQQGDERHNILEVNLQTTFHPEPSISDGYAALDLRLENEPASVETDSMIHQLATIQHPDGHWSWNLPRPPIQASDITATAQAVYAIQSYGIPARRQELDARVNRAREWLLAIQAETNEERVHQLLGLVWAGEKSAAVKKLADDLTGEQRADGGWGQLAGLDSDAYATGQALYALMEGGKIAADDPAIRRGIDFLLCTQLADGTWHVRTRAHPFQPPMDSGFPHGRDGWISASGTSWAVMALATSLDPSQGPPATQLLATATTANPAVNTPEPNGDTAPVEFARDIEPLLKRSCRACHGGVRPKGGFQVSDRDSLLKGGARGEAAVVPGQPDASLLVRIVQDQVEDLEMPPLAKRDRFPALSSDEIQKLRAWIAQGANWPDPTQPEAPSK